MRSPALALALCLLAAPAARADHSAVQKTASARYQRGVKLADAGDYFGALSEFDEAYRLAPRYQVLYSIAVAHWRLQHYGEAIAAFERYLHDGGDEIGPPRKAEVDSALAELRAEVAEVTVVVVGAPADLSLDGRPVGSSPLPGSLLVSAGRHLLTASRVNAPQEEASFDVTPGREMTVTIGARTPPPRPRPTPPPIADEPPPRPRPNPPPVVDRPPPVETIQLATLSVRTQPAGARLSIDGRVAGQTPFEGELAPSGHRLEASLAGRVPASADLELSPGEHKVLSLVLRALPQVPWYKRVTTWVGIVAAVAVVAIVVGVVAWYETKPYATIDYPPAPM